MYLNERYLIFNSDDNRDYKNEWNQARKHAIIYDLIITNEYVEQLETNQTAITSSFYSDIRGHLFVLKTTPLELFHK